MGRAEVAAKAEADAKAALDLKAKAIADAKTKALEAAKAEVEAREPAQLDLIARWAAGERGAAVASFQSKFDEAMRIKHGGLCQNHVHSRRQSHVTIEDRLAASRKAKAAVLANADDDEYGARNARADAEAALNVGAIDAEIAEVVDDDAMDATVAAATAAGELDAEAAPLVQSELRMQRERRARAAEVVTNEERAQRWEDELVHPPSPRRDGRRLAAWRRG